MHPAPGAGKLVAGRYRLLTQLGRGAMGVVWHGRDELLDRDVAVKQIVLGPAASDDDARQSHQRTIREARTAARLSHPGVVTIYDVADQDGMPWIVMELVRARPLEQVITEDGPLTPPLAAQLGLGLLDALACAHAAGVLHRDVKPSNVLITPEGKAVLTDFGIAAILGDPAMTREGLVAGTPGFSPPERVRGATATPASDLWSLGATLYAAVEGRGPFDRAGGPAAIVASIATEPAPRAPSAGPLASVIDALLQSDPAQRPDAAATRRMLVAAWSGARRASRLGAAAAAGATATGGPAAGNRGPDATTATQVVTVEDPGEGHDRRLLAAKPAAGSARDVVPDLMATPVFAELSMPGPDRAGTASPGQPPDAAASSREAAVAAGPAKSARSWLSNVRGAGDLIRSRRALVLTAPLAATAIVAGIVFLAFPGFGDNLLKGQLWHPGSTGTGT
ncbi:MAG TPA: protein kinase, partial [Streptosporangiaceae bacterium]